MKRLPHRKNTTLLAAAAALLTATLLWAGDGVAMGDKPTPQQQALKQRCDALTQETGEPHFYGEGKITRLVDFFVTDESMRPDDFKSFIAIFENFSYERTYIKATYARWEKITPLKEGNHYAFCYTVAKSKKYAAINHPETMLLLEE